MTPRAGGGCDCSALLLTDVVISDKADISTHPQPNTLQTLLPRILPASVTTLSGKTSTLPEDLQWHIQAVSRDTLIPLKSHYLSRQMEV